MKAFATADLLPKSLLYGQMAQACPLAAHQPLYKAIIMGLASAEAAQMALRSRVLHQTAQRRYHSSQYSAHRLVCYSLFNNHAITQEMHLITHREPPISCYPLTLVHRVSTHRQHNNAPRIQPNQSHVFIGIFPTSRRLIPASFSSHRHTHTLTPLWALGCPLAAHLPN